MASLDYGSSIPPSRASNMITEEDQSPILHTLMVPRNSQNQPEPTTISMDMETSDYELNISSEIAIIIKDADQYAPTPPSFPDANPRLVQLHNHRGILYLLYAGAIVVMFPSLAQIAQLKFQNKQSPFETHSVLTNTAVVAYTVAIPTSIILFYMRAQLESSIKGRFSPTYMILKSVFCFSGILAPLSLVLVLSIPHGFTWIGYSIIFALFVIIMACSINDHKKLLCKIDASNLGVVQRDETSSHSIRTISE